MSSDNFSLPDPRFPRTLHLNDPQLTDRMHADFRELWAMYGRSLQTAQDALAGWRDAARLLNQVRDALYEEGRNDHARAQKARTLLPYTGVDTDE